MLDVVTTKNWFWVLIVSISNELDGTSNTFTEHKCVLAYSTQEEKL
jgi:hypothetical protein